MATKKTLLDRYPQTVTVQAAEDVAGDGKVVQVPSTYSLRERMAMEILGYDAIPYGSNGWATYCATNDDYSMFGLSHLYRGGALPDIEEPTGLIDVRLKYYYEQSGAGFKVWDMVESIAFPAPIIAHPASLWVFVQQMSGTEKLHMVFRIKYRLIEISDQQWQEIFESILIRDTI